MNNSVTIILPVYNEADNLKHAVKVVKAAMKNLNREFEIIIAEDGSSDETPEQADNLIALNIRVIHSKKRLGRGISLRRAIKESKSDIILFMDVDLSTSLDYIRPIVSEIENGAAIATGSRLLPNSLVKRNFSRNLFSKTYNLLVRTLTGSRIKDHQCGFKAFHKPSILQLLEEVKDNHWFWDTELLVRAQKRGLKIAEIPVEWVGGNGSKVNLLQDAISMGMKLIKLSLTS